MTMQESQERDAMDLSMQPVARRTELLQSVYYFDEIDNQYKM
jgi:hypothetical protein